MSLKKDASSLPTKKADPTVKPTDKEREHSLAAFKNRYEKLKGKNMLHLMPREGLVALGLADKEVKLPPSPIEGEKEHAHHRTMLDQRRKKLAAKRAPHQPNVHAFVNPAKGELGPVTDKAGALGITK